MNQHAEIEAQAADWIARRDGPGWSAAQQSQLQAWLDLSTAHRAAFLRLDAVWRRADRLRALRAPMPQQRRIKPTRSASNGYQAIAAWTRNARLAAGAGPTGHSLRTCCPYRRRRDRLRRPDALAHVVRPRPRRRGRRAPAGARPSPHRRGRAPRSRSGGDGCGSSSLRGGWRRRLEPGDFLPFY